MKKPDLRRAVGTTGTSLAMVGLLASPALACWDVSGAAVPAPASATTAPVSWSGWSERAFQTKLTAAQLAALIDAKLSKVSARTAADTAQWEPVADSTILSKAERLAARADLRAAHHNGVLLALLERSGTASPAQAATTNALQADLTKLVVTIGDLLDNTPAAPPKTADPDANGGGSAPPAADKDDRDGDRDGRCDHDGWRDGSRDGSRWDGHRDGDGWDSDREGDRDGDRRDGHRDGHRDGARRT